MAVFGGGEVVFFFEDAHELAWGVVTGLEGYGFHFHVGMVVQQAAGIFHTHVPHVAYEGGAFEGLEGGV